VKVWSVGKLINEGKGEHTGGHPILPLWWLANDRRKRGDGLQAGMLVSTSSSTGAYRSPTPALVIADYGAAGTVEVSFTG
jgi:2-keto-4-pentenoate hydratase